MFLPNIYVHPSLSFPPRSPQSPQDAFQDTTQHFVTTFSQLILVVTVSENFIDFDVTSTVWRRAGQVSQWTPFHLHFSVFLTAEPGLWILLLPLSNIIVFGWNNANGCPALAGCSQLASIVHQGLQSQAPDSDLHKHTLPSDCVFRVTGGLLGSCVCVSSRLLS